MAGPLTLVFAGAVAVVFFGSGKRRPTKKRSSKESSDIKMSLIGQPCDIESRPPESMICKGGVLYPEIIDEHMLEKHEDPTGEDAGDFDIKEEDMSLGEEEEWDQDPPPPAEHVDQAAMCNEFLQAVHVAPTEDDESYINKVAVEQTVIPAMKAVMRGFHENSGYGPVDIELVAPIMVTASLNELVPVCEWEFNDGEFTFNDGMTAQTSSGRDVIFSLMQISAQLIDDFNDRQELLEAGFQESEVGKLEPEIQGS